MEESVNIAPPYDQPVSNLTQRIKRCLSRLRKWPWRTIAGVVLTIVIIGAVFLHLINSRKCSGGASDVNDFVALLGCQSLPDIGQWLSGVAGALAFLWLVIGYFQQGEELKLQREELRLQRLQTERLTEEAAKQAKSIDLSEQHTRKDLFFRFLEISVSELAVKAALILDLTGNTKSLWEEFSKGDKDIFFRHFITVLTKGYADNIKRKTDTAEGKSRINDYLRLAERIFSEAEIADSSGWTRKFCADATWGKLYTALTVLLDQTKDSAI